MKKRNAFTLIELLAVIVILAIIALIVTPVVSNIVSNAKIAANARSVEGHIRNVELAIISKAFSAQSTGDMNNYDGTKATADIEGVAAGLELPTNDNVTCTSYTILNGTVQRAEGCKDKEDSWSKTYTYTIANGAEASDGETTGCAQYSFGPGLYYSIDPDVDPDSNGKQNTEKKSVPDESWLFFIREYTEQGVTAYEVYGRQNCTVFSLKPNDYANSSATIAEVFGGEPREGGSSETLHAWASSSDGHVYIGDGDLDYICMIGSTIGCSVY